MMAGAISTTTLTWQGMKTLAIEALRALLRHDPETGKLYWLPRDVSLFADTPTRTAEHACNWWNARFAGQEAFTATSGSGGRHGKIFGSLYYAHRVIWALHHGAWPTEDIDHEDGDRAANVIGNLREADHRENMQNKALYRTNKSGHHGVSFHQRKNRWESYITVDGKRKHLGTFTTLEAAIDARRNAERATNVFHANHGRARK